MNAFWELVIVPLDPPVVTLMEVTHACVASATQGMEPIVLVRI